MDLSDLSKLRVVDLKQELQNRGLDTKGVKAVLISRLQAAIDEAAEADGSESNDVEGSSDAGEAEESILPDEESSDAAKPVTQHSPSPEPEAPPLETTQEAAATSKSAVECTDVPMEEPKEDVPQPTQEVMEVQQEAVEPPQETLDVPQDETEEADRAEEGSEDAQEAKRDEPEDSVVDAYTQNETMPMDEVEKKKAEEEAAKVEESGAKEDKKRRRSRSPSSNEGSARRRPRRDSQSANADDFLNIEDEPALPEDTPCLSWVDSDLYLKISGGDFCEGRTMSDGALGLMWAGVRATHGVTSGRVFYEVQPLQRNNRVSPPNSTEENLYHLRCGWSTLETDLYLGQSQNSFAYDGEGKKCHLGTAEDFGVKFEVGDVIGVYLDMESTPCKVQYTVNGEDQGVAFEFDKESLNGKALFPHVLTKNVTFKVNFGQLENTLLSEFQPRKRQRSDDQEKKAKEAENAENAKKSSESGEEEGKKVEAQDGQASGEGENAEEKKEDGAEEKPEGEKTEEEGGENKEGETAEGQSEATPKEEVSEEAKEASEEKMETDEQEEVPEKPINRETLPNFVFIGSVPKEELVSGPKRPETRKECEVIMMIGLPGCGKTNWVNKWNEENPEKRYNIIGDNYLFSRLDRDKYNKSRKFDDMCNRSFIVLQELAQKRRRNYILDQTNVFASAQRRKMKGFGDFKRIAVIVIPDDEEYKKRVTARKNEWSSKDLADAAVNEMKANFSLPTSDLGWFDEIKYVELQEEAATKLVVDYNEKGRRAMPQKDNRRPYDDYRDRRRRDYDHDRRWDRGDRRDRWAPSMGGPRGPSGWRPPPPRDYYGGYGGGYDRRGHDRWNSSQSWMSGSGGRRSNERDYRRDYGHQRDYQRSRDRDGRSGRSGRDQDFRERRSDNRGGGGDNYGSRSSHSSSRSSHREYSSSKGSGSSSMKGYSSSAADGMVHGGAAMATQGGASWGAAGAWPGQQQWPMAAGNWGAQGWQQWNAGGQHWGGWNYGAASNGADWSGNSWDVNQAVYTTNSCPNVDTTSDQTN
ncbi:heterogeneous nuclear ribonucleoprotein U-like protein 2 isoform X2 [Phlebotomus papatasi]|uniref:heterogeneous nuclear ribonucleoprotein U-like protein 2 isoform X2 n=1 Tax=Phlebotomus papatasi TaxID=29031 RepID=UPI00248399AB|nr:heterogeneous nuclear ribonucleoprotein U-like protein 2 isoform X2 [Phlebotomus papatasi]